MVERDKGDLGRGIGIKEGAERRKGNGQLKGGKRKARREKTRQEDRF